MVTVSVLLEIVHLISALSNVCTYHFKEWCESLSDVFQKRIQEGLNPWWYVVEVLGYLTLSYLVSWFFLVPVFGHLLLAGVQWGYARGYNSALVESGKKEGEK